MKAIILSALLLPFALSAQNGFQLIFSVGQGNSSWQASPLQMDVTDEEGNIDTSFFVDTHGNGATVIGSLNGFYTINRFKAGIGFTVQHFFIDELFSEAFGSKFPTVFTATNDPQPTHFKFYPHIEYAFIKQENFELFTALEGGTFLTHDATQDSIEAFHWFTNIALGLNYQLNENLYFSFTPSFDFSRFNTILTVNPNNQKLYYNIYSFYFSAGIKYEF